MLNEYKVGLKRLCNWEEGDLNVLISENWEYPMELTPNGKYVINSKNHEDYLKSHGIGIEWFDDHAQLIQDGRIYLVEVKHEPDGILLDYSTLEHI